MLPWEGIWNLDGSPWRVDGMGESESVAVVLAVHWVLALISALKAAVAEQDMVEENQC